MINKSNKSIGAQGEELACRLLLHHGYKIITTNFNTRAGEIDIICRRGHTLIFVEVKTRQSLYHGFPEQAMTPAKQRALIEAAAVFMQSYTTRVIDSIRFDCISILLSQFSYRVKHYQNCIIA